MKNIIIIPGSYKPPHKGHLSLIEKLLKLRSTFKIIIIISNKSRPLDDTFLYMEQKPVELLKERMCYYFPNEKNLINKMSKSNLIKYIQKLIKENVLLSINANQSLEVWNIYLNYLKKKYKNLPKI